MPELRIKRKNIAKKVLAEKPENAYIYTRVSSDEQVKGYSLDAQKEECIKFADSLNINIERIFQEEGESAKTLNRTEMQKLRKSCKENKNKIKYVIVWKIERLTRSLADLLNLQNELNKIGIKVLSVTEPNEDGAGGNMNRNMLGVMAQFDNELKSERVTIGMKKAFNSGRWLWRAPFGYVYDKNAKNIVPHREKGKIVQRIFKNFATGCYSQADILSDLKKNGTILCPTHLSEMLRNPIYCGWMYKEDWCSDPVKGAFKAIVSEKDFNLVQDILDGRKPAIAPHDMENEDYPLKQFLYCPYCGKALTGSNSISQRGKKLYQYYSCYNKNCPSKNKEVCKSKFNVAKDVAEKSFLEILTLISPKDEVIDLFKDIVKDVYTEQTEDTKAMNSKLQKELNELLESKKALVRKYAADKIQEDEYNMALEDYKAREQEIKSNLQIEILTSKQFDEFLENALTIIQNLSNTWNNGVLRIKKNIQNLIFPNGLSADFSTFQNSLNPIIFKQIGSLTEPCINLVPLRFEISKQFIDELISWNEVSKQIQNSEDSALRIHCAVKNNKPKRHKSKERRANYMT